MSFGAFSRRALGSGTFDPGVLTPILIYDHVGLGASSWVPSLDLYSMGTLAISGSPGTVTSDWGGSGKPIVSYGSARVQTTVAYARAARTWAFVGRLPSVLGGSAGITSSGDAGGQKIYPMYASSASSGTLGTDFTQGTSNRALFTGINSYLSSPFVLVVSAIGPSELRGHLLAGGTSQAGLNTTTVSAIYDLNEGMAIGGWHVSGGDWGTGGVAAVGVYQEPVLTGAPGAAQLLGLASHWAALYPGVPF